MNNVKVAKLALWSFAGVTMISVAQDDGRIRDSSFRNLPICQSEGDASRLRACVGASSDASRLEEGIPVAAPAPRNQCEVRISSTYVQRDTLADVEGTIEVEGCAKAEGEYTVSARVRDANGNTQTLEFIETWQLDNDGAVNFEGDYPIGENAELLNLHLRGVSCDCVGGED